MFSILIVQTDKQTERETIIDNFWGMFFDIQNILSVNEVGSGTLQVVNDFDVLLDE